MGPSERARARAREKRLEGRQNQTRDRNLEGGRGFAKGEREVTGASDQVRLWNLDQAIALRLAMKAAAVPARACVCVRAATNIVAARLYSVGVSVLVS